MSGDKLPDSNMVRTQEQTKSPAGPVRRALTSNLALLAATVILCKILAFTIIWLAFGGPGNFQNADLRRPTLTTMFPTHFKSLYLLTNWDSHWYMQIAMHGYAGFRYPLSFAESPFYPFLIYLSSIVTKDVVFSAVAISFTFGVAWVLALEKTAELYLSKSEALSASLLAAFFPLMFFLTTIAYSESLFLFLATTAWLLYVRRKYGVSSLLAGACAVTRQYGIVIAALISFDLARQHKMRQAILFATPALVSLGIFVVYGYMLSGDPLFNLHAFISRSSGVQGASIGWFLWQLSQGKVVELSFGAMAFLWYGGVILIICLELFKVDVRLAIFSIATFLLITAIGPNSSLARLLLGTIFPLWLGMKIPRKLVLLAIPVFFGFSLLLLYQFNSQIPNLFP